MGTKHIPVEEFVRAWQTCNSAVEAAKKLGNGRTPAQVSRMATYYRKRGIPLKRYSRGRQQIDIEAMAALAKELENDSDE